MPEMSGSELAQTIRNNASLKDTKLLLLHDITTEKHSPLVDSWLTKPVLRTDLYHKLLFLIGEADAQDDKSGFENHLWWFGGYKLLLVEDKHFLMHDLGKKQLIVELKEPASVIPTSLASYDLTLSDNGNKLTYTYDTMSDSTGITALLQNIHSAGLVLKDLQIKQTSLEDIFVNLVNDDSVKHDLVRENQTKVQR